MRALSATELLSVWQSGSNQIPLQRALTMLAAACPETPADLLARLTIGQRDAQLLTLREMMFGSELSSLAECPECGEKIELSFSCSDIRAATETTTRAEFAVESNGREVHFRLPTSEDLLAIKSSEQLLQRCALNGDNHITEDLVYAAGEAMSTADPMADVHARMNCSNCTHAWEAPFDILAFLWREISASARMLLHAVHTLASAYGWTEKDILALSPARRGIYLEMANG